eukprot:COSAG04_NODE_17804_length_458_cov_1.158774_1_plen_56_part_10
MDLHAATMAALEAEGLVEGEGALCCTEAGFVCVKVDDFYIKGLASVFRQHGAPHAR